MIKLQLTLCFLPLINSSLTVESRFLLGSVSENMSQIQSMLHVSYLDCNYQ